MNENETLYGAVKYFLEAFERVFNTAIEINGVEKLENNSNPTLFVSNHFTRFETFMLPYIIHKYQNKRVRVIADDAVFVSYFGEFLQKLGAVSTSNPKRDDIIISDLIKGDFNWLIFPEGMMVKNKRVVKENNKFFIQDSKKLHKVYTGASFFALKSQWVRDNFSKLKIQENQEVLNKILEKYNLTKEQSLSHLDTYIVPITINYIPIRAKNNIASSFAKVFFKDLTPRIKEELMVEGELLGNSKIVINIGTPINAREYITEISALSPLDLSHDLTEDIILNRQRYKLTEKFLTCIYSNIVITMDHIFASVIHNYQDNKIDEKNLKLLIYAIFKKIEKLGTFHIDKEALKEIECLISDEDSPLYDLALKLAFEQSVLHKELNFLSINKNLLNENLDFHQIRLKNTLKVYVNELLIHKELTGIIKEYTQKSCVDIKEEIFQALRKDDLEEFYKEREDAKDLKPEDIGIPKFLDGTSDTGIVLIHGFSSAPKEMEELGKFLNKQGFKIYLVRLQGHGTTPKDLSKRSFEDWYNSFNRGYKILNTQCKKVVLCGFSTGGLIALLAAKRKKLVPKTICINAALRLEDLRIHLVSVVKVWNDLVGKEYKKESIDNLPENPEINYNKQYVTSINELKLLMEKTNEILDEITSPLLIIQGGNDPVVDPKSADEIFYKVNSLDKKLVKLNCSNHVIVRGNNAERVFEEVLINIH